MDREYGRLPMNLRPIERHRGASGAKFFANDERGTIVKQDTRKPGLIVAQAVMMRSIGQSVFPRVYEVGEDWYEMEFLEELYETNAHTLTDMYRILTRIWRSHTIVYAGDHLGSEHEEYVVSRSGVFASDMVRWLNRVRPLTVTQVEHIHGDPTVDNVMMKRGARMAFIDPLPSSSKIPPLQAVDCGKMLQSCWGYEEIKKNRVQLYGYRLLLSNIVLDRLSPQDAELSTYFLCVHILRLIPYQPEPLRMIFWNLFRSVFDVYGPK